MPNEINPPGLLMTPSGVETLSQQKLKQAGRGVYPLHCIRPETGGVPTQFYKFLYDIFEQNNLIKNRKKTNKTPLTLLTDS
jgi:hypothetical protein